jgi:hypothetical protein
VAIAFRQGFVRHPEHSIVFFALVGFVTIALASEVRVPLAVALGAVSLVFVGVTGSFGLSHRFDPVASVETAGSVLQTLTDGSEREERTQRNRDAVRAEYGFSDQFLAPIGDATVAIQPFDLIAAYAYPELEWRSLPVFQDYSAYTSWLDDANADALASADAPAFVIRQPGLAIDGRWSRWEPPAATLALACRYRAVAREGEWLLLQRGDNRCGDPETIGTTSARFGEHVNVPVPETGGDQDAIVLARFEGVNEGLPDRLRTALFRAPEYFVDIGDGVRRRFVPGTQRQWHVVRAPECVTDVADRQPVQPTSLRFLRDGSNVGGPDTLDVQFAVVPFEC